MSYDPLELVPMDRRAGARRSAACSGHLQRQEGSSGGVQRGQGGLQKERMGGD